MTTTGKRRRYPTGDSPHESDDDNGEILNTNPQLTSKRRVSAAADFASHRFIVSERRQLAVLKQLTASKETNCRLLKNVKTLLFIFIQGVSPSSVIPQSRPTKIFRRNEHGETIVHIAARKGDLKQLKEALKDGANVNEEDNAGKKIREGLLIMINSIFVLMS
jgi:ankyrin repeat protein